MKKYLKILFSTLIAVCLMFTSTIFADSTNNDDLIAIEDENVSTVQPRINYSYDLSKATVNVENLAWQNLDLSAGDKITFKGTWTPSKAAVVITLYWYSTEKGKYVKMSEYTSLKTGGTYKFNVYEPGLYKVYFKPSYPITGGTIVGSFN